MKLSDLKVDPEKERNGVPVEIIPGVTVTVRSLSAPEVRAARDRLLMQYRKIVAMGGTIPPEAQDNITATLLADHVVTGWQDKNGELPPFSKENARKIFGDPAWRRFRDLVYEAAGEAETFRQVVADSAAKN